MSKIKIILFAVHPINFNGDFFHHEEFTVESEAQAQALIGAGCARDVNGYFEENAHFNEEEISPETPKNVSSNENKDAPTTERIVLIKNTITQLDPTIKSHWDKDKSPALRALNKVSGETFLKGERDYVWALINS